MVFFRRVRIAATLLAGVLILFVMWVYPGMIVGFWVGLSFLDVLMIILINKFRLLYPLPPTANVAFT